MPTGNLESPINLDSGRKPTYPEAIYADTGRICNVPAERTGMEPGPALAAR